VFACMAACSVLLQSIALAATMGFLADELPYDGNVLMGETLGFLRLNLLVTLAFVLPLNLIIGRTVTFKIAGPLYRFEVYLKQLIRGERPGPCRIRRSDELQDFCGLLNEAVKPLSQPLAEQVEGPEQREVEPEPPPAPFPANRAVGESSSQEQERAAAGREWR